MKVFISTLLLLAVVGNLEANPAKIINPGAARNSAEVKLDTPQGIGSVGVADPSATAGGNSQQGQANQGQANQGSVIHSSGSSGESNPNIGVQAGGGATGGGNAPDAPGGPDSPDFESAGDSLGGGNIIAEGGVPFGGAGGAGGAGGGAGAGGTGGAGGSGPGGSSKSSTPPPDYGAAPGLIVSEGGSGSAAIAVLCVVGVVGIAAGVGFFIYKRK